ncbi:MAG: hypothetical protein P8P83_05685 [Rickettsiaceae bacterium]|nr:hypothetical protein [Rickettsiaceae bacterium]
MTSLNVYYFQPKFEQIRREKTPYLMKLQQEQAKIKPARVIECLTALGKVNIPGIWVNVIEYSDGHINLVTHSLDTLSIDKYISEVSQISKMFVVNQNVQQKDSKLVVKIEQENNVTAKKVPFGLALLQKRQAAAQEEASNDQQKINSTESSEDNEDFDSKIPEFTYTATIKLKI